MSRKTLLGRSCLSGGFGGGGISSRGNRGQKWASAGCFHLQGELKEGGSISTVMAMGYSTAAETPFPLSCSSDPSASLWRRQGHPTYLTEGRLCELFWAAVAHHMSDSWDWSPGVPASRLCLFLKKLISVSYWEVCLRAAHDKMLHSPLNAGWT